MIKSTTAINAVPFECDEMRCVSLLPLLLLAASARPATVAETLPPPGFPVYRRGAVPNWLIPIDAREDGLIYLGTHARLRAAIDRVKDATRTFMPCMGSDEPDCCMPPPSIPMISLPHPDPPGGAKFGVRGRRE